MTESIFTKLQRPFAVLDSEWHDGNISQARLISLAVTLYKPLNEVRPSTGTPYYWVFDPGLPILPDTTQIHGFDDAAVTGKPTFADTAQAVLEVLKDADIGGYSVAGDIQVIQAEFTRAGLNWDITDRSIVDPFRLWNARERRRLEDAYELFVGKATTQFTAHDAADDVSMTIRVIEAMAGGKSVEELHDEVHSDMVDIAGKFKRNEQGEIVFGFGQYRGEVARLHNSFLNWMSTKDFPPSTMQVIDQIFREEEQRRAAQTSPASNDWQTDEMPF